MSSMVEHQVFARREGQEAVLQCKVCKEERRIADGAFAGIHEFIQAHKGCATG